MTDAPLRVGLAGYGQIAERVHAPALRRLRGARLCAVAESDSARRYVAGRLPGVRVFADFREILSDPDVDAVVICLPSGLHAEAALAARAAGKHLYLEKPLAVSAAEGRPVVEAWRNADRTAMIGFNYRFHPLLVQLRTRLRAKDLGSIHSVRTVFHSRANDGAAWKKQRDQGGGVLLDLASHHFDLLFFLFDSPVARVHCVLSSRAGETAEVQAHLECGVEVKSSFSLAAGNQDWIQVRGERGSLMMDRQQGLALRDGDEAGASPLAERLRLLFASPHARAKTLAPHAEPSYKEALGQFVAAAQSGQTIPPTLEDGYRSLCVVAAAEESDGSGKEVAVNYETS